MSWAKENYNRNEKLCALTIFSFQYFGAVSGSSEGVRKVELKRYRNYIILHRNTSEFIIHFYKILLNDCVVIKYRKGFIPDFIPF